MSDHWDEARTQLDDQQREIVRRDAERVRVAAKGVLKDREKVEKEREAVYRGVERAAEKVVAKKEQVAAERATLRSRRRRIESSEVRIANHESDMDERDEALTDVEEGMLSEESMAMLAEKSGGEINLTADTLWVYENFKNKFVKEKDAPGPGAWGLLDWATTNVNTTNKFYEGLLPKAMAAQEKQVHRDQRKRDDGREIFELIDRLLEPE